MKVTYYGHSCFGVEVSGKHLVFDPFITPNELAAHIRLSDVKADYILVSHGHEDHLADLVALAQQTQAKIICSWEIFQWASQQGLTNIHPMNTGGKIKFDFGSIKCVVAQHSSSLPDGSYGGNPMGFVIESTEGSFYYAGDTALTYDMKLIGDYRKIDFAFLPIGDNFTMGVDNAIIACEFIKCGNIIGMHFDTFGYIKIDKAEAIAKFEKAGYKLNLLPIGETTNY